MLLWLHQPSTILWVECVPPTAATLWAATMLGAARASAFSDSSSSAIASAAPGTSGIESLAAASPVVSACVFSATPDEESLTGMECSNPPLALGGVTGDGGRLGRAQSRRPLKRSNTSVKVSVLVVSRQLKPLGSSPEGPQPL